MEAQKEKVEHERKASCTFQPNAKVVQRAATSCKENTSVKGLSQKTYQKIYQCNIDDLVKQCTRANESCLKNTSRSSQQRKSLVFNNKKPGGASRREPSQKSLIVQTMLNEVTNVFDTRPATSLQ